MELPVLIEPLPEGGFRATCPPPVAESTEGTTEQEALDKLRQLVRARLASGAKVVLLKVGPEAHPLAAQAGVFKDDPLFDEWQAAIAEHRRGRDAESDEP